jgi:hypothetical protein
MKVRWNRSSVRLRLTPSELASLLRGETVTETLELPGGASWSVQLASEAVTCLTSIGNSARLHLSPEDRQRLAAPDAEGVYFQIEDGLRYWVEKDFPCAHPRAAEASEPTTETFDAPDGFEQRKNEG